MQAGGGLGRGVACEPFLFLFIYFLILKVLYVNFDYKVKVFESFQVF
jgi:hypothetical protein